MPHELRRLALAAGVLCVALGLPEMARAEGQPDGGGDKKTTAAKPASTAPAQTGGFVFPPPSGTLNGTVPGASRGVAIPAPAANKPLVKPAASTTGAKQAPQ